MAELNRNLNMIVFVKKNCVKELVVQNDRSLEKKWSSLIRIIPQSVIFSMLTLLVFLFFLPLRLSGIPGLT